MVRRAYLDTHVIVWLYAGDPKLISKKAISSIEKNDLFYSPMVSLELTLLKEIGRIKTTADKILNFLHKNIGLTECTFSFSQVIAESHQLNFTRDPFDRIIVSQASLNDSLLISKDRLIKQNYKNCVW